MMVRNAFLPFISLLLVLQGCNNHIKFDRAGWSEQSDPAFPPTKRKPMLYDLLGNYHLKGKHYREITELLGEPDFSEGNEFGYVIEENYGSDIDPVYTKNLLFIMEGDSTVGAVEVKEWKK